MWKPIKDCGKQLTIHSKVREKNDEHVNVYDIIEVEFDQYKLELISRSDLPVTESLHQILNCEQMVKYNFEVEDNKS